MGSAQSSGGGELDFTSLHSVDYSHWNQKRSVLINIQIHRPSWTEFHLELRSKTIQKWGTSVEAEYCHLPSSRLLYLVETT